jgi:hypothetical protein
VEFIYVWNGIICENQVHVLGVEDFTPETLLTLWTTSQTWWNQYMKPLAHTSLSLTRIKCKAQYAPDAPVLDEAVLPPIAGTDAGFFVPNNVSFALKLATGLAGRSARGRWYAVGLTGNQVLNGVSLKTNYASTYVVALNALKQAYAAQGFTLCITSYRTNNAWRAEAVSWPVSGILYTDVNLDSQRRRLAGRGK